jgi:hypothetical protein
VVLKHRYDFMLWFRYILQLIQIGDTHNFMTCISDWKSCQNCDKYTRMYSKQCLCGICTLEIYLLHLNFFLRPHTVGDPVFARFEFLRAMFLRIQVFCDVTLCQWVTGSRCYEGIYCLHLRGSSSPRD